MIKKFKILFGGECFHPERSINKKGSFKSISFPAIFFYIETENQKILFDTGYSNIFFEASKKFPFYLYRKITKLELAKKDIIESLKDVNVDYKEINYIFISHFHPDHIGNLKLFENTKYICHSKAYESLKNLKSFKALRCGFLKEHLPDDFEKRLLYYDKIFTKEDIEILSEFENTYKIFDNFYAVELEGHSKGHSGLFFKFQEKNIFLIADSAWRREEFENMEKLPFIANLILDNSKKYYENLIKLNKIYNKVLLIPSHCKKTYKEVIKNEDFI